MRKVKKERVFLDYASITPQDKKVGEVMRVLGDAFWGNPSSLHKEGEEAKRILEEARKQIAHILHCKKNEVYFTSGGTESLNLAILGTVSAYSDLNEKIPHVIVSTIEHPAILEPIKHLVNNGKVEVSFVSPNEEGVLNPESIKKEIKENTVLVVVQHANNEIGTIQPIHKISSLIKEFRNNKKAESNNYPYLLVDASQSVLYEDTSIERLGADIMVLDGIKMYGPRGSGVLVVRHGLSISSIVWGGGQEKGLRSGTENVVATVGLAKALDIAVKMRVKEVARLKKIRDYAITKILKEIPNSSLNGSLEYRLPNNINICFKSDKDLDSEFLVIKLDTLGLAVSASSACHTLSLENSSYVINALGNDCGSSSLRFTLGRDTSKQDLDKLISALVKVVVHKNI